MDKLSRYWTLNFFCSFENSLNSIHYKVTSSLSFRGELNIGETCILDAFIKPCSTLKNKSEPDRHFHETYMHQCSGISILSQIDFLMFENGLMVQHLHSRGLCKLRRGVA